MVPLKGLNSPLFRLSLAPIGRFLLCIDINMQVAVASNLHYGSKGSSLEMAENMCCRFASNSKPQAGDKKGL